MAKKNEGIAIPILVSTVSILSSGVFHFIAAKIPSGTPTIQVRKITITVNVTCKDMIKKAKYFEQSFSSYTDYKPSGAIMVARNQAIEESLDKIAEDIVLKTVSNW